MHCDVIFCFQDFRKSAKNKHYIYWKKRLYSVYVQKKEHVTCSFCSLSSIIKKFLAYELVVTTSQSSYVTEETIFIFYFMLYKYFFFDLTSKYFAFSFSGCMYFVTGWYILLYNVKLYPTACLLLVLHIYIIYVLASVADPWCLSGSQIQGQKDSGSRIRIRIKGFKCY